MTKQEFFEKISDVLQLDETATSATELTDDIWDSASQMATMAFFGKEFAQLITLDDLVYSNTVGDLLELAKEHIMD